MTAATVSAGTPPRSRQQRLTALTEANRIRTARAEYKLILGAMGKREAREEVARILRDPPPDLATMQITKLLLAVPRMGMGKVSRILNHTRVSASKTLAGLTGRQVEAITRSDLFRGGY